MHMDGWKFCVRVQSYAPSSREIYPADLYPFSYEAFSFAVNLITRMPLAPDVDLESIATTLTADLTGADLEAFCRQAAFCALERGTADGAPIQVTPVDFQRARMEIVPSVAPEELEAYEKWQEASS